jgi:predicted dienelactone hydrolase
MRGRRARALGTAVVVLLLASSALSGCGDSSSSSGAAPDPAAAGPYAVGVTRVELRDEARGRTLLTEIWYPADESARGAAPSPAGEYLPPDLAFLADGATLDLTAVREAPIAPDGPFPLIAFSHGSGGIRFQNTFQVEHLASHGYVVIAPDHQGNTFFDSSGSQPQLAIDRPIDVIYLLNAFSGFTADPASRFAGWIDTERDFGVTGHSFGAFTSFAVASQDARIGAALPMALAGPISGSYSAATLLMLATQDKTIGLDSNQAIRDAYEALPGPRFLAEVIDAGHYSFSFACETGLGIGDGDGCKTGTRLEDGSPITFLDHHRVWPLVNTYSAALFGRYLRDVESYDDTLATNLDPEVMTYVADLDGRARLQQPGATFGLVLP